LYRQFYFFIDMVFLVSWFSNVMVFCSKVHLCYCPLLPFVIWHWIVAYTFRHQVWWKDTDKYDSYYVIQKVTSPTAW